MSNEEKNFKELEFLGLSHCFSVIIEKNFEKPSQKWHILDVFEDYLIRIEIQRLELKKNEFLEDFCFI